MHSHSATMTFIVVHEAVSTVYELPDSAVPDDDDASYRLKLEKNGGGAEYDSGGGLMMPCKKVDEFREEAFHSIFRRERDALAHVFEEKTRQKRRRQEDTDELVRLCRERSAALDSTPLDV